MVAMFKILYVGNKLAKHGVTPTTIDTLGCRLEEYGEVYYASETRTRLLRLLDMAWTTVRHSRDINCVLIDTYSSGAFYYALVISQLARLLGLAYVPILHGGNLPQRMDRSPRLVRLILNHSKANVTPSAYLLDALRQRGFQGVLIPNSIDLDRYPFRLRSDVRPRLLYVRSLHRMYNPKLLIEVARRLTAKYSDFKLCFVGPDKDGSKDELVRACQDHGLVDQVEFAGYLSKEAWIKRSQEFDIFVNPTHFDNQPVSIIEAMALGLPVVSTRVGGIPFLVENKKSGWLVEDSDVDGFVHAIETLVSDDDLCQRLSNNGRIAAQQYDWSCVQELWQNVLNNG